MAKKRQRRTPQVPRSNPGGRTSQQQKREQAMTVSGEPRAVAAPRMTPPVRTPARADFSAEYAYVRKDLMRIFVLAVLLFSGMGILRLLGF